MTTTTTAPAPLITVEDDGTFTRATGDRLTMAATGDGYEGFTFADPTPGRGLTVSGSRFDTSHGLDVHGLDNLDPATVRVRDWGHRHTVKIVTRDGSGSIALYTDDRLALAASLSAIVAALLDPSTHQHPRES